MAESIIPPKHHILVASFPAFGHIIPTLEFAKKLSKFHHVTYAVSASKVPELTKRELITDTDTVNIYGIPDGVTDDFDNPADSGAIGRVFQAVLPAISILLRGIPTKTELGTLELSPPIDIVIVDNFFGGPAAVCHERNIQFYLFSTGDSGMIRLLLSISEDSPTISEQEAQSKSFMGMPEPDGGPPPLPEKMKAMFMTMKKTLHFASGIIINSFREIEEDTLQEAKKSPVMDKLTTHCVGPLLPVENGSLNTTNLETEKKVGEWLDQQQPNSVIYISFGSMTTPSPAQLMEIGLALLEVGHPVIWSIRDKYHEFLPDDIAAQIYKQFSVNGSRFLILPWAPQKMILGHAAVGVFVSHCGWNSVLEGLSGRKPVVAWPMFADQLSNSQWIAKIGAGLVISKAGMKNARVLPVEEIVGAIREVTGWKLGGDVRSSYTEAAFVWGDKMNSAWKPGGSSYEDFMDLIQFHQAK